MTEVAELLEAASTISLVDWPDPEGVATLVRAGYVVVAPSWPADDAASPYLLHEVVPGPAGPEEGTTFPLADGSHLRLAPLDELASTVDIVCIYRPPEEQQAIVEAAVAAGAPAVWIERGAGTSPEAKDLATAAGVAFVEDRSIAEEVRLVRPMP